MRVRVKISFHDSANFARVYNVGELVDFTDERARSLIALGLVDEVVKPNVVTPKEEDTPKRKTTRKKKA